jgi:hypothetical protein
MVNSLSVCPTILSQLLVFKGLTDRGDLSLFDQA